MKQKNLPVPASSATLSQADLTVRCPGHHLNANTTPGVANNPGAQETEVGRLLLIQGQPWRHSIQGQSQPELHSTC